MKLYEKKSERLYIRFNRVFMCLIRFIFSAFAILGTFSHNQGNAEALEPNTKLRETKPQITSSDKRMRGIVLVSNAAAFSQLDLNQIRGISIDEGLSFLDSFEALRESLKTQFLDREINSENLLLIKNEILAHYNQYQQNMITVEIPEQEVTQGVVVLEIKTAQIGTVSYSGNRWYSKERVAKKLSLYSGKPIDQNTLLNDVSWLNQNPFHYTKVVLSPGEKKNQTNLEVVTKDRFPLRVYAGGDNTGVESSGTSRFYGGFTWGDAFFVDDILMYQFTSNVSYNTFHSHTVNYVSYLPWKHSFSIYGGYAEIHPNIANFRNNGKDAQASIRYRIPFKPLYTNSKNEFFFGFDYKYLTSALFFVAELDVPSPVQNSIVNVTQGVLGYAFEYTSSQHQLAFRVELFGSPTKWLPHQSNQDYSALRHDAKPIYFYGKAALGDVYTFSTKDSISGLLTVQGSANTLIPSEQFALGGYNTVRGYDECVYISDNAICVNLELRSRPLTFSEKIKDELTLLAFLDCGWGNNYHAFDGIAKSATLCGIGPGLRYTINPYVYFRVDYGFKLSGVDFDTNKLGMWHVGGTLSY